MRTIDEEGESRMEQSAGARLKSRVQSKVKTPFVFLRLFVALMVLAAAIVTICCAKEYTVTFVSYTETPVIRTHCTVDNGNVAVSSVRSFGDVYYVTVKPVSMGGDVLRFTAEAADGAIQEQTTNFWAGPFGTVFNYEWAMDFRGSIYVILIMLLAVAGLMAAMFFACFEYLKRWEFCYSMVGCGGVGLFCLAYLITNGFVAAMYMQFAVKMEFTRYFSLLASAGNMLLSLAAPLMTLFCAALIISNIVLIRHEGFHIFNLLGVGLSVLWFSGRALTLIFDDFAIGTGWQSVIYSSLANGIAIIVSYFLCMLFSTVISAYLASRRRPPHDRDYIVILGCALLKDGTPTPILRARIDAALRFAREQLKATGKRLKFVPSGGQGSDEAVSEGASMKRYLLEQGVDEADILPEERSVNTDQNFRFSKEIIEADAGGSYNAAFATTNYHVFRGYILAKKHGVQNVRGISSKTKWYFFPNAFLREFVGLVVDKWKRHVFFILLAVVFIVSVNIITFPW